MSDNSHSNRLTVTVQEARILVSPAQSSKLAALRAKARGVLTIHPSIPIAAINTELSAEVAAELYKVQQLIDLRCAAIMSDYPALKQKKLFSLRFGSIETLKTRAISRVVKQLNIDTQTINLRLLTALNYWGERPK